MRTVMKTALIHGVVEKFFVRTQKAEAHYADNKSWFVVKSVNFRIGDMVSIIEKVVLSEEQEATEKARNNGR
jgi:hypothetical protein